MTYFLNGPTVVCTISHVCTYCTSMYYAVGVLFDNCYVYSTVFWLPMDEKQVTAIVVGAGSRGFVYANYALDCPQKFKVISWFFLLLFTALIQHTIILWITESFSAVFLLAECPVRRFVTLCKIAPYRNSLIYLLTYCCLNVNVMRDLVYYILLYRWHLQN